jgi:hypothetical protein
MRNMLQLVDALAPNTHRIHRNIPRHRLRPRSSSAYRLGMNVVALVLALGRAPRLHGRPSHLKAIYVKVLTFTNQESL